MSEFNWDDIIKKDSGEQSPPVQPQSKPQPLEEKAEDKDAVLNKETVESINKQVTEAKKQLRNAVSTAKRNVRKVNIRKFNDAIAHKRKHIIAVVGFIGVVALGGYVYTHHTPTPKPTPTPVVEQLIAVDPVQDAVEEPVIEKKPEPKQEVPQAKAAVEVAKPPPQKPRPKAAQKEATPKPQPQQQDNWNKREANKRLDDFFNN